MSRQAARSRGDVGRAGDGERGSVTTVMLAVIAVVLVLGLGLAGLSRAAHAHATAQASADLAALAAARVATTPGGGDPCATAARVAQRHETELVACSVQGGGMVQVRMGRAIAPWAGWPARAGAVARAGPVGHG